MAFELGQQVSKDKFILQRHPFFNLTRILPKFNPFQCSAYTQMLYALNHY